MATQRNIKNRRGLAGFVLLGVLLLSCAMSSAWAGSAIDSVEYEEQTNAFLIKIALKMRVDYVKHFPFKRGKFIQIQLHVDDPGWTEQQIKVRDIYTPASDAPLPLINVIYEGSVTGGPFLVLRFPEVAVFTVDETKGNKQVVVRVEKSDMAPAVQAPQSTSTAANPQAEQLMRDGRAALTRGENENAILLFTQLLNLPDHDNSQDAKEYLGLARERNGQLDMAKKEYDEYLVRYGKTPRAETVRQRLMTLSARLDQQERRLKEGKRQIAERQGRGVKQDEMFGRWSQVMLNSLTHTTADWSGNSVVASYLDLNRRIRDDDKEVRYVFSGSNESNLSVDFDSSYQPHNLDTSTEHRVRALFAEYKGKKSGVAGSFGRQTASAGGVLGRFDGLSASYQVKPKVQIGAVGGMPVDFEHFTEVQTNKPMGGIRVDVDDFVPAWKGSAYFIHQQVDGIVDRSAIGADARYFEKDKVFYSLFDFDVSYGVLNFLTAHYGWRYTDKTKFDVHVDQRRSPVMLTSNALIGVANLQLDPAPGATAIAASNLISELIPGADQEEIDVLKENPTVAQMLSMGVSEEKIRERALGNTGKSLLISLGSTHDMNATLQLNANFTYSQYSAGANVQDAEIVSNGVSASANVVSLMFSTQLIQRDYFVPRDVTVAGLRFDSTSSGPRFSVNGTYRVPYGEKWRLEGRMRLIYANNDSRTLEKRIDSFDYMPTAKAEYAWTKKTTFEAEGGLQFKRSDKRAGEDYDRPFANLGYRYMF